MESQIKIPVKVYKSLKSKSEEEAKKFLKQNFRLAAKKIIDAMPEEEFNNIFEADIDRQEDKIIINVKLKRNEL